MRGKLLGVLVLVALFAAYRAGMIPGLRPAPSSEEIAAESMTAKSAPRGDSANGEALTCESKTYCSEMRSCAEAKFYLQNCPGTKMDGDHDGIPCESQWCGG